MICTAHNLLKLFTLATAPEPATLRQMPGRDAYLDGLLEIEIRKQGFCRGPRIERKKTPFPPQSIGSLSLRRKPMRRQTALTLLTSRADRFFRERC